MGKLFERTQVSVTKTALDAATQIRDQALGLVKQRSDEKATAVMGSPGTELEFAL